jgi:F-type H+-transporting ATPase subunit gamma
MKALAASSIGEYEKSVLALADYYHTVELGLGVCFRDGGSPALPEAKGQRESRKSGESGAVVFGSDQGLVGQFNEVVADYAIRTLAAMPGKPQVWAVGDRVQAHLADAGLQMMGTFTVPSSVMAISALVGQIQVESESHRTNDDYGRVYLFHNRPLPGAMYEPVSLRMLPLDELWLQDLAKLTWPGANLPEVMCQGDRTLRALIREYLFITLFRACAESLASENASRLAAMERADANINELLESLQSTFHRIRQGGIDEELFDVVSGFEALNSVKRSGSLGSRYE